MDIRRVGSQPSTTGSPEWFTGPVRVDPLFEVAPPSRAVGICVTFEPGARSLWHAHPLGQHLDTGRDAACRLTWQCQREREVLLAQVRFVRP